MNQFRDNYQKSQREETRDKQEHPFENKENPKDPKNAPIKTHDSLFY
jgi:hypothetical protein